MGTFTAGSVVLVRFPFSDLSQSKLRPAVVVADCGRGDWLLCQITSNAFADPRAVTLTNENFREGTLNRVSYVRIGKLFTASSSLITRRVGLLQASYFEEVRSAIYRLGTAIALTRN
jgi:mRNA interferase MazF